VAGENCHSFEESTMVLRFITPQDTIRVIADSIGRDARRQLVGEVVTAWVDDIPEQELALHYAKAVAGLDEDDLHILATWHSSLAIGQPIANTDFLLAAFPSLGPSRREALKIAAGFRGERAFDAGVTEERALTAVLGHLSTERAVELAERCIDLYIEDRLGGEN
jgi:hypothetical protein